MVPSLKEEKAFRAQGYRCIAGVDEVGRGALAGPVMAAAVILPPDIRLSRLKTVRDSKMLTPAQRERLFPQIQKFALAIGIGATSHEIIDRDGIASATQSAMRQAIAQLAPAADAVLIDYFRLPGISLPQKGVPDGDGLCLSIACASIVAKVTRDRLMRDLDAVYPGYAFADNKGYGTGEHLKCLDRLGPCAIHRRSFRPVSQTSLL